MYNTPYLELAKVPRIPVNKKNRSSVSESLDILNFFSHVFYGSNLEEDCQISWYNSYRVGYDDV